MSINAMIRAYHDEMDAHRFRERKRIDALKASVPGLSAIEAAIDEAAIAAIKHQNAAGAADPAARARIDALKAQKRALLAEHHIDPEDLRVRERCPRCHDTGYADGAMCVCLKKRLSKAAFSRFDLSPRAEEENFDTFRLDVYPESKDGIPVRSVMAGVLATFRDYCARFDDIDENYLFTGVPGLGKTFLSGCIAAELIDRGYLVVYLTAEHLVRALIDRFHAKDDGGIDEALAGCDLLIIDDFGAEYSSDFSAKQLFEVINGRLLSGGKMIISTNLNLADIQNLYDRRLASRIAGHFKPIGFYGNDIRLIKRRERSQK